MDKTCFKNPNISPKICKCISTSHVEATSRKLKLETACSSGDKKLQLESVSSEYIFKMIFTNRYKNILYIRTFFWILSPLALEGCETL